MEKRLTCNLITRWRGEREYGRSSIWRYISRDVPKIDKRLKSQIWWVQQIQRVVNKRNPHLGLKQWNCWSPKTDEIFKRDREKWYVYFKGAGDFSVQTIQVKRQWNNILKCWKKSVTYMELHMQEKYPSKMKEK